MKLSYLLTAAAALGISHSAVAAEMTNQSQSSATVTRTLTTTQMQGQTVLDLAASNSEFSTLARAIQAAGLQETLRGNGPLTVFAPTNAAFEKLGQNKLNELLKPENKAQLTQILTYHVVPQSLPENIHAAPKTTPFETAEGQSLMLRTQNGQLLVQDARALDSAPMKASNGQIIAIDTVLMPEANSKLSGKPSLITPPQPAAPQNVARVPSAEAPVTQKRAIAPESPTNVMRNP